MLPQVHPERAAYVDRRYTDLSLTIHNEQSQGRGLVNHYSHWLEGQLRQLPQSSRESASLMDTPHPDGYQLRGNQWIPGHSIVETGALVELPKDEPRATTNRANTSKVCVIV